jgi:hypothetical protein
MFLLLEVATVILASVAVALSLAHALELPGKLRLSKEQYLAVQPIYYPGFTFAGIAEPLAILASLVLLLLTPAGTAAFWLTAGAFVAFVAMHAAYWLVTHPVNNFWLKDVELKGAGKGFFSMDPLRRSGSAENPDWTYLRDRWEYSHVLRAGLAMLGLILLVTAVALNSPSSGEGLR